MNDASNRTPPAETHASPRSVRSAVAGRGQRGFALLMTVTLLAFLVVLLVGLAAYTRVETAVAGNVQRQAQARENALTALEIALAQLQKYAGPDQRVTATAEGFPNQNGTSRYTGVWHSDPMASEDPTTPLTWLVSGNETFDGEGAPRPLAFRPDAPGGAASLVVLVGAATTGSNTLNANYVRAPLRPIQTSGVPGMAIAANTTIGRYAWWVGDQGVKASVAVPDVSSAVNYAPYDSADQRARLRQQIPLGAGAADTTGTPVFDPRESGNTTLVSSQKVTALNQIAFLRRTGSTTTTVGLAPIRTNFHAWTPINYGILANTKLGGLRQDLSVNPELLGPGYVTWANYPVYMENPFPATVEDATEQGSAEGDSIPRPSISPAYGSDPIRRRYYMQAPSEQGGVQHTVAPVLSYFLLTFNVRTQNGSSAVAPLQARARWMFSLWNPYTAALVPEDLRLEISGLPAIELVRPPPETEPETPPETLASIPLEAVYGEPLKINLPWDAETNATDDRQSWLPGRVHTWTSLEDLNNAVPDGGFASKFDSRVLDTDARQGVQMLLNGLAYDGNTLVSLRANAPTTLTARLFLKRADGDVLLATFTSPRYDEFSTTPQELRMGTYQFSYLFRLAEGIDTAETPSAWLLGPVRDPRRPALRSSAFVAVPNGPHPELYPQWSAIQEPDRLLDRATRTFDEDVPLFELPRGPILSLGALQHMSFVRRRAFTFGNSWSAFTRLNDIPVLETFDRFFYSGLAPDISPTTVGGSLLLPNPLLRPLRSPETGGAVTADEMRAAPEARTSKYLLQGGAFNLNSTNATAWAAVLRNVRFPAPQSFRYLNVSSGSGTAGDTSTLTVQSTNAQFFRFPQSAQETYETGELDDSLAGTANFRRGMRTLTPTQVADLSARIVGLIRARHAALGPFRSVEEFLQALPDSIVENEDEVDEEAATPTTTLSQSLLERAIEAAGVNSELPGFSSQWLTQADIMTALAPILFPRSDTFVIRAYGEAVNPATNTTEGRAWCEAIVQRMPEYFDPSSPPETPPGDFADEETEAEVLNKHFGRRFKIVSFRWLTRSDI